MTLDPFAAPTMWLLPGHGWSLWLACPVRGERCESWDAGFHLFRIQGTATYIAFSVKNHGCGKVASYGIHTKSKRQQWCKIIMASAFLVLVLLAVAVGGRVSRPASLCPGYRATSVLQGDSYLIADLRLIGNCESYSNDIKDLRLLVEYQTGMRLPAWHHRLRAGVWLTCIDWGRVPAPCFD